MVVLVALEHKSMDDEFTVSKRAADMEPDKMLLIAGEKLTLKELLDEIFLASDYDLVILARSRINLNNFGKERWI